MNELSYSQKKYLFAIYKLYQSGGEAKSSEVAKIVVHTSEKTVNKLAEHILKG